VGLGAGVLAPSAGACAGDRRIGGANEKEKLGVMEGLASLVFDIVK
jgi:hypothetical protein